MKVLKTLRTLSGHYTAHGVLKGLACTINVRVDISPKKFKIRYIDK